MDITREQLMRLTCDDLRVAAGQEKDAETADAATTTPQASQTPEDKQAKPVADTSANTTTAPANSDSSAPPVAVTPAAPAPVNAQAEDDDDAIPDETGASTVEQLFRNTKPD